MLLITGCNANTASEEVVLSLPPCPKMYFDLEMLGFGGEQSDYWFLLSILKLECKRFRRTERFSKPSVTVIHGTFGYKYFFQHLR